MPPLFLVEAILTLACIAIAKVSMKIKKILGFSSRKQGYTFFFISLIGFFLLTPFLEDTQGFLKVIFQGLFLLNTFLAIQTLNLSPSYLLFCRVLACLAFIADIIILPSPFLTSLSTIIGYLGYLVFFILATFSIGIRINTECRVNLEVIEGAVCIYLLIGIIWFLLYSMIRYIDPQAFSINSKLSTDNYLLYFSFTTLTTVGYGDISPINPFARTAANLEAIIGQLYPAIFIARLVSLYSSESKK